MKTAVSCVTRPTRCWGGSWAAQGMSAYSLVTGEFG